MTSKLNSLLIAVLLYGSTAIAQLPVETFTGDKRMTIDIMFFRFFKKENIEKGRVNTPWLFFNRNRASIDYRMTSGSYLPQFGFTEAISYNPQFLKGFAPVAVGQVLNSGAYAKAGIQYARIREALTVFTWGVSEIGEKPRLDHFLLLRYTPMIVKNWKLFSQLETVSSFPTISTGNYSFVERMRFGLSYREWQFGLGTDLTQTGRTTFIKTVNTGIFLRHEF